MSELFLMIEEVVREARNREGGGADVLAIYFRSAHNVSPIEKLLMKICTKAEQ